MKKILMICLQTVLFTMTCCVMSKYGSKNFRHENLHDKTLRKGPWPWIGGAISIAYLVFNSSFTRYKFLECARAIIACPKAHSILLPFKNSISEDGINPRYVQTEMPPGQYCLCSKIYDPVCASNNESYFNLCYLECKVPRGENISVIHQGNCIPY